MKTLLSFLTKLGEMKAEFYRRKTENYKTLIRGSVLDPENHPSKQRE